MAGGAKIEIAKAFDRIRYLHPTAIDAQKEEKSARYCPHEPYPGMQTRFLRCASWEKALGGIAGPGKTDVQLQDALQWVGVPGYSCLITRAQLTDLRKGADSPIERFLRWLDGTDAKWSEKYLTARFPGGATVTFSHCRTLADAKQQKSNSYHKIIVMEASELVSLEPYLYLMTRLRRMEGYPVPTQIQCDFNPDAHGCIAELKARFIPPEGTPERKALSFYDGLPYDPVEEDARETGGRPQKSKRVIRYAQTVSGEDPVTGEPVLLERTFIPGYREDHPRMDWKNYGATLSQAGLVVGRQLGAGDWEVSASGRYFSEEMFHDGVVYDRLPSGLEFFASAIDPGGTKNKAADQWCRATGAKDGRKLYLDDLDLFHADTPVAYLCAKAHMLYGWGSGRVLDLFDKCGPDKERVVALMREIGRRDDRNKLLFMESDRGAHAVWQDWQLDRELRDVQMVRVGLRGSTKLDHAEVWRRKLMFGEMFINRRIVEQCKKMWIPFQNDKKLDAKTDHALDGVSVLETGIFKVEGRRRVETDVVSEWINS